MRLHLPSVMLPPNPVRHAQGAQGGFVRALSPPAGLRGTEELMCCSKNGRR